MRWNLEFILRFAVDVINRQGYLPLLSQLSPHTMPCISTPCLRSPRYWATGSHQSLISWEFQRRMVYVAVFFDIAVLRTHLKNQNTEKSWEQSALRQME